MNLFVDLAQKVSRGKRKPDQSRVTQVKRTEGRGNKKMRAVHFLPLLQSKWHNTHWTLCHFL